MATAACKASELAFDEYKAKVIEELGEEKENQIRQSIAKDHVDEYVNRQTPLVAPFEKYLCREEYSGYEFYSNLFEIKDAFIGMNYNMVSGNNEMSFMEYMGFLGLDSKDEDIGWNVSMTGLLDLNYRTELDAYGRPLIVFGPSQRPYENYNIYG